MDLNTNNQVSDILVPIHPEYLDKEQLETSALFVKDERSDGPVLNSREFVEKIDEILCNTNKLFIKMSTERLDCETFKYHGVTSVYDVLEGTGNKVFTFGRCPVQGNTQSFVISNSVGHGLMTLTTTGLLNRICDVGGAGLLTFTQIQNFHGGYTLRDPYKELLKIHSNWIPFCTCCLLRSTCGASMAVVNLDGTPTGSICFRKWLNLGYSERCLCVTFIPNLNPKAKYMLFAASLKPLCSYFSEPHRTRRSGLLVICYSMLLLIITIICIIVIKA